MSNAGVQSNRGDHYQTLIAAQWALTILVDERFGWIEIDSVRWGVDDIIIGYANGSIIFCQCKKNQTNFKDWTISDLKDDLKKSADLLISGNPQEIKFYSRNNFSSINKLKEHAAIQPDEATYKSSLREQNKKIDKSLSDNVLNGKKITVFEFLKKIDFEVTPGFEEQDRQLCERMRYIAARSHTALDVLWAKLTKLGARTQLSADSSNYSHRYTRQDLLRFLNESGVTLTPAVNVKEVLVEFTSSSAIGRSWRQTIANLKIKNPAEEALINAIKNKHKSILLTGGPGSGKTSVILAVQSILEEEAKSRNDLIPIFVQTREYADLSTSGEREARGLPAKFVDKISRLAETSFIVVIVDSLDVLSIARSHEALGYFLTQIERLRVLENVTVVAACREFDLQYDKRISNLRWDKVIKCHSLDWNEQVLPLLNKLNIDPASIDVTTRQLINNYRDLDMFVELSLSNGGKLERFVTSQELAQRYLDTLVRNNSDIGEAGNSAIEASAVEMLRTRSLSIPRERFNGSEKILQSLLSHNVMTMEHGDRLAFGHQTILDVLVISEAVGRGVNLIEFIGEQPPVPFIRPSIRNFVIKLAAQNRKGLAKELKEILTSKTALHIRRLVAETYAEQVPLNDDWNLLRDLRTNYREIFNSIYVKASRPEWYSFWARNLFPSLISANDEDGIYTYVHISARWLNDFPGDVLSNWASLFSLEWIDTSKLANRVGFALREIDDKNSHLMGSLLRKLVNINTHELGFSILGELIAKCLNGGGIDDRFLWESITRNIDSEAILEYKFGDKLNCRTHDFGNVNDNFLPRRMQCSTVLLDYAIESIENWRTIRSATGRTRDDRWLLRSSSYEDVHNPSDSKYEDTQTHLIGAIEVAVAMHVERNSEWWKENKEKLAKSDEILFRYFAIIGCTRHPECNLDLISILLVDSCNLRDSLKYECGQLLRFSFVYLKEETQNKILGLIYGIYEEYPDESWVLLYRASTLKFIPSFLLPERAAVLIQEWENQHGEINNNPDRQMTCGYVEPPFSYEEFIKLSDTSVIKLLKMCGGLTNHPFNFLIGGAREIANQLDQAVSRHPSRFLKILSKEWLDIPEIFKRSIVKGVESFLLIKAEKRAVENWHSFELNAIEAIIELAIAELNAHSEYWTGRDETSDLILACAYASPNVDLTSAIARTSLKIIPFNDTTTKGAFAESDQASLLEKGINKVNGTSAEMFVVLISKLDTGYDEIKEDITNRLYLISRSGDKEVKAVLLNYLPYLYKVNNKLLLKICEICLSIESNSLLLFIKSLFKRDKTETKDCQLWKYAERNLYINYFHHYDKVKVFLDYLYKMGRGDDLEIWGRISALAALNEQARFPVLIRNLQLLNSDAAWTGAMIVWTNLENLARHQDQCFSGIEVVMEKDKLFSVMVGKINNIFRGIDPLIIFPQSLYIKFFDLMKIDSSRNELWGIDGWLSAVADQSATDALFYADIFMEYIHLKDKAYYDHENRLTKLLNTLFNEAEQKERSDEGVMLRRVVKLQDILLSLDSNGVKEWLRAAERH